LLPTSQLKGDFSVIEMLRFYIPVCDMNKSVIISKVTKQLDATKYAVLLPQHVSAPLCPSSGVQLINNLRFYVAILGEPPG
jgi:hypothetical protein